MSSRPQRWAHCAALLRVAAFSAAFAHPEAGGSMEPSHLIYNLKVQTWVRSLAEPFMRSLAACITLLCANVQSSSASEFSTSSARVLILPPVAELHIVLFIWQHASNGIGCSMHPMVLLPPQLAGRYFPNCGLRQRVLHCRVYRIDSCKHKQETMSSTVILMLTS